MPDSPGSTISLRQFRSWTEIPSWSGCAPQEPPAVLWSPGPEQVVGVEDNVEVGAPHAGGADGQQSGGGCSGDDAPGPGQVIEVTTRERAPGPPFDRPDRGDRASSAGHDRKERGRSPAVSGNRPRFDSQSDSHRNGRRVTTADHGDAARPLTGTDGLRPTPVEWQFRLRKPMHYPLSSRRRGASSVKASWPPPNTSPTCRYRGSAQWATI